MLNEIFFTFYHANGKAELKNFEDHAANPVKIIEEFHSQFQLRADKYLDNNNYIKINQVETQDSRILNIFSENSYEFIDMIAKPAWVANTPYQDECAAAHS